MTEQPEYAYLRTADPTGIDADDVTEAVRELIDAVAKFNGQARKCEFYDSHGHELLTNARYREVIEALAKLRGQGGSDASV